MWSYSDVTLIFHTFITVQQVHNQLGTPGGAKSSEGTQIFETMSNTFFQGAYPPWIRHGPALQ